MSTAAGGSWSRAEEQQPAYELAAVGNDEMLWLIVGRRNPDEQKFLQRFFYVDGVSSQVRSASRIAPQVGRIERCALVGESLHVFFVGGVHYRYRTSGPRREIRLPDHAVPAALAGEAAGKSPHLWAMVGARTAHRVEADWQAKLRRRAAEGAGEDAALPADDRVPAVVGEPVSRAEQTYHLVQYDGTDWQPGFAAPDGCGAGGHLWLAVSGDRHYVLWQPRSPGDSEIQFAWHADEGDWTVGPPVQLVSVPRVAFAAVMNRQLFFTALAGDPDNPRQLRCASRVWLAGTDEGAPGRWERRPSPEDEQGEVLRLPVGSAVGGFGDQFGFLRMGPEQAEVGFWPTAGGPPTQAFREMPGPGRDRGSPGRRELTELVTMLLLAAVVFLVFWRRQESIAHPVALPAGMLVAGAARRAAAVVIDMLPVAAVVLWRWYDPITSFYQELQAARESEEQRQALVVPEALTWAWIWFRLLYAGYCTVFELWFSATPGKRLLGCSVLSESLARPNAVQIGIRNVTRLVELEPRLLIWPFVLVIFLTRNRQRIGDLLARTIVVEGQAVLGEGAQSSAERQDE